MLDGATEATQAAPLLKAIPYPQSAVQIGGTSIQDPVLASLDEGAVEA